MAESPDREVGGEEVVPENDTKAEVQPPSTDGAEDRASPPRTKKEEGRRRRSRSRSSSRGRRRRSRSRERDRGNERNKRRRSRSRSRSRGNNRSRQPQRRRSPSRSRSPPSRRSRSPSSEEEEEPLPIFHFKQEIIKAVREANVLVCKGETGSGKTTQLPQYLFDEMKPVGLVGVTQPRRVAAISVATRVAQERKVRLGDEVGYQIRFEDRTCERTKIKFMTDGCLVRECLSDPLLRKYSFIMLDEAHERSVNTDILFGLMKRALSLRKDLKVIVTSATLDVHRFSGYFWDCPVKEVPVRTFPVDIYFSKTRFTMTPSGPANDSYVQNSVDLALKIHQEDEPGHILIFLTGQDEIEKACSLLNKAAQEFRKRASQLQDGEDDMDLLVLPLYGMLTADQQVKVFHPVGHRVRKCIVATNIAETSLTVPGVRYVVDPGFVKQKTYNAERRMESLVVVPISRVAAEQRAGRAGRTGPGKCYRLYSRDAFGDMMSETVPEIRRSNLSNVVLYLKVLGIDDVIGFDYFEAPLQEQLEEALLLLHALGALDDQGQVTDLGKTMSQFPLEPSLSRTLIQAVEEKCVKEVLTISAVLSVETIWYSRKKEKGDRDEEADRAHAIFRHPRGDHITYLMIYAAWEQRGFSDDWLKEVFLSVRAMRNARNVRKQLEQEVRKAGLDPTTTATDVDCIARAFTAGFFNNAAGRCGNESVYKHMPGLIPGEEVSLVYLHPTSVLAASRPPQFVIYHELIHTAKAYMRHALGVERSWLLKCRERVGQASIAKLTGGQLAHSVLMPESDLGDDKVGETSSSSNVVKERPPPEEPVKKTEEAISDARRRFLERKNAKKTGGR